MLFVFIDNLYVSQLYPTIQFQRIEMSQPPTNQKRTPTRRDLEATFLAGMVGTLARQIIVRPITITILGDSHLSHARLGRFERDMADATTNNIFRFTIISRPGLRLQDLLQNTGRGYQLLQQVYRESPDICIIAVGGNDIRRYFSLRSNGAELGQHMVDLGTLMQQRNIMPVWLEIPPRHNCDMDRSTYQQFCRQANQTVRGRGNGLRSIPLPNAELAECFEDGVHFTVEGYKIIAHAIRNYLNKLYCAFRSNLQPRPTSQAQATAHTASNPSNDPTLAGGSSQTAHKHKSNPERNLRPVSKSQKMKAIREKRSRPFLNRPPYQARPGPPSRGSTPSNDLPIPGPSVSTPSNDLPIPGPSVRTPSDDLPFPGPPNIRPQSGASSSSSHGLGRPLQSRDRGRPIVLPNGPIRTGPEGATATVAPWLRVAPFHVVPPAPHPPNRPITYMNVFLEEPVTVTVRGVPTSSSSSEDSS